MTIQTITAQLTELQRQEDAAYQYMLMCENDYWPDRYPDARDKYHAAVDKFEALLAKLKAAEAQGGA